jgi:hypothetical protein
LSSDIGESGERSSSPSIEKRPSRVCFVSSPVHSAQNTASAASRRAFTASRIGAALLLGEQLRAGDDVGAPDVGARALDRRGVGVPLRLHVQRQLEAGQLALELRARGLERAREVRVERDDHESEGHARPHARPTPCRLPATEHSAPLAS